MQERVIHISTLTILKVVGIIIGLLVLWLVRDILVLIFVALFLAALIQPAADWGARYKIPRGLTVLVVYLLVFTLAAAVVLLMVPTLLEQVAKLASLFGQKWTVIQDLATAVKDFAQGLAQTSGIKPELSTIQDQAMSAISTLFQFLSNIFGSIVAFVIVLVMAFYLVAQEHKALTLVEDLVPSKHQKFALSLIGAVQDKMGYWLRGQLLLCLIIGILYYIGLLIIGVDSSLILAIFGGLTEFIPYLGPILGGIPIVFVAFIDSPFKGFLAIILLVIIQQIEGHFIVPKVMQKAVGLNPLVSIISMLVGAKLFGVLGALLAIPVATAVSVMIKELREYWSRTM